MFYHIFLSLRSSMQLLLSFCSPEENNLMQTALLKGYPHLHFHQQWTKICSHSHQSHCILSLLLIFVKLKRKEYFFHTTSHILSFSWNHLLRYVHLSFFSLETYSAMCWLYFSAEVHFLNIDSQEFFIFPEEDCEGYDPFGALYMLQIFWIVF